MWPILLYREPMRAAPLPLRPRKMSKVCCFKNHIKTTPILFKNSRPTFRWLDSIDRRNQRILDILLIQQTFMRNAIIVCMRKRKFKHFYIPAQSNHKFSCILKQNRHITYMNTKNKFGQSSWIFQIFVRMTGRIAWFIFH